MNTNTFRTWAPGVAFFIGLSAIVWVAVGFMGTSAMALTMTVAIGSAYLVAASEVRRFATQTQGLSQALAQVPEGLSDLDGWLVLVPEPLRGPVRQRIRGERTGLPGLALTPYVIGLLVMLGMLGTFLGMVVTFKGAVFALEGSADLAAIRSALAAPIKGLGVAFGTSVAGVASSAMLGLMSAMVRRQRQQVLRALDAGMVTAFYPFSMARQRQATLDAMQAQAQALPEVVASLGGLIERIEQRGQQLDDQLLSRQDQFHREATAAYSHLSESVARSLHDSLTASARVAGETLQPVVVSAMAAVAAESQRLHGQVSDAVQQQLQGLSAKFSDATASVTQTWSQALQDQAHTHTELVQRLDQTLGAMTAQLDARSTALVTDLSTALNQAHSQQSQHDQQRQAVWSQALDTQAHTSAQLVDGLAQTLDRFNTTFEQRLSDGLAALDQRWSETHSARAQADQAQLAAWGQALQSQAQTQSQLVDGLAQTLARFNATYEQRAAEGLAQMTQAWQHSHDAQVAAGATQQTAWNDAWQQQADALQRQWQQVSADQLAQQQATANALAEAAQALQASASAQASGVQADINRLLQTSQALVAARTEAEARWAEQQGQRMDGLAALWRSELAALRQDEGARSESAMARMLEWQAQLTDQLQTLRGAEDQRGQAAVERLGALQEAMASHLATLGAALEAPMTRLMETASQAPKAAAEVIAQLRQEMSHLAERDNRALQERGELIAQIGALLQSVQHTTGEQREAIETLVRSASSVLNQVGDQFTTTLGAQASRTDEAAAQVAGSAAELASLGEAFHQGVQLFSESNAQLVDKLAQVESAIQQSLARSDDQLAYYVAQAREVIDLSISSQQGIVEDLRRLRGSSGGAA